MKNKKGNAAVILIIVVILAITAGVITWLAITKTQAPVQQKSTASEISNLKKQNTTDLNLAVEKDKSENKELSKEEILRNKLQQVSGIDLNMPKCQLEQSNNLPKSKNVGTPQEKITSVMNLFADAVQNGDPCLTVGLFSPGTEVASLLFVSPRIEVSKRNDLAESLRKFKLSENLSENDPQTLKAVVFMQEGSDAMTINFEKEISGKYLIKGDLLIEAALANAKRKAQLASLKATMASVQPSAIICWDDGSENKNSILSGNPGSPLCSNPADGFKYPEMSACGPSPDDARFIVTDGATANWKISLSICTNFPECAEQNVFCSPNGCKFGEKCK